jgi:hypothetical protein
MRLLIRKRLATKNAQGVNVKITIFGDFGQFSAKKWPLL